ncbi:Bone morphogenetic protein 1 [Bulinus truncatus]|nr:Bone morphogenetic protein 1 [Bulinus truncatus]
MITRSLAYTLCPPSSDGKFGLGESCSSSVQCVTDYCSSQRCTCPTDLFHDPVSGYCVSRNGTIKNRQGDCGYIVSHKNILAGSLNTWTIVGSQGTILEIDLDINYYNNNYVEVVENSNNQLDKLCIKQDSVPRLYASLLNILTVNYRGTFDNFKGFRAIYYVRGPNSELKETSGYIASPGYPIGYYDDTTVSWLIFGRAGFKVILKIHVEVEANYDYVILYNGRNTLSPLLRNYTGVMNVTESLMSSSNFLLIRFTTDGSRSKRGFNASYEIVGTHGYSCSSSVKCINGLVCYGGTCSCLTTQYYDHTSDICRSRLSHGSTCASSEVCDSWLVCRADVVYTYRCLCPSSTYSVYGQCYSDSDLNASLTNDSIVKKNSAEMKWTTNERVSSVVYNVTWSDSYRTTINY